MTKHDPLEELRSLPFPKEGERICAWCLMPVSRETYDAHMQYAHGFETLTIHPLEES